MPRGGAGRRVALHSEYQGGYDEVLKDGKMRHKSIDPWVQIPKTGTWVRRTAEYIHAVGLLDAHETRRLLGSNASIGVAKARELRRGRVICIHQLHYFASNVVDQSNLLVQVLREQTLAPLAK